MPAVMRRTAAISVLLATTSLLCACGRTGKLASAAPPHTASTGAPAPSASAAHAPTGGSLAGAKARARAFARAVNLTAADLPGFSVSTRRAHEGTAEKRLEPELLHCVGATGTSGGLAEEGSQEFERKSGAAAQTVSSEVTVARTPALAAKELAAFRSGHLQGCLSHYFNRLVRSQDLRGASVGPVSARHGSPPAPGTDGGFGLRFVVTVTLRGIKIPFYIDILGFVDGSAEVSLLSTGLPEPLPATAEEQLFTLLVERAKSHSA
jgi:hypothetical protein